MAEYLQLIGLIFLVYLIIYTIINRICDCIERYAYVKSGLLGKKVLNDISGTNSPDSQNCNGKEEIDVYRLM